MMLTGRTALLAALGIVVVLVHPDVSTVLWWLVVVAALVGIDLCLAPATTSLAAQRLPVRPVRLGDSSASTLTLRNTGSRELRGAVRDAWQPSAGARGERMPVRLAAGEQTRLVVELTPTRRGDRRADRLTTRTSGPLGLAMRQRSVEVPGAVRALPAFPSRRHLPSRLAQLRQIDGRSAVRTRGQGTEFDSLRDYVDGDDVRSIDWRATARRQHPVVRTWQPERDRRVVIVLDTSRTSAGRIGDSTRLDVGMDATLLLTALASRAGDRVSFLAGDRTVRSRVAGVSDRAELLHTVINAMATVEPALVEANWRTLLGAGSALPKQRSLLVLVTPLEPAAIQEGLLPVVANIALRHRVVIASVADPGVRAMAGRRDSTEQAYDASAAERTELLRNDTRIALERLGVTVLDEEPDALPVALVDHYLLLKSRGLL
ncbi:lipoprotein [Flexivirga endophytica]|uniref:Lipoprotein n=1 Tax=Flexivirga endophytica TaxID=1849103 RepID=A0A916WWM4_9MICO|nr:DUF58 domain-containing protein [Flexivirga endophytica]GGB38353.1 lipoprotein [Flexivirga endophytica]GHB46344.1 lipoprotein [Flexivirga endophytica]